MTRFRNLVIGVLTLGLSALAYGGARTFDPRAAPTIAVLVLAAGLAGGVVRQIVKEPVTRRLRELGIAIDRAAGVRLSRYGSSYLRWVDSSLRFLETKGLATVGDFTPELGEVFVDVGLVPNTPVNIGSGVLDDSPIDAARRQSIWEFLSPAGPSAVLMVIGAPGSGKTTLLRHVARALASEGRSRARPFPVLLQLRDHVGRINAEPRLILPQVIRDMVSPTVLEPPDWWDNSLRRGKCLVLLDGLDEVGGAGARRDTADWVSKQISAYPRNDYIITSRPHGYRDVAIESAKVLQVRPFTQEQVRKFLVKWYVSVERRATGSSSQEVTTMARRSANDLLSRLATAPALFDLTVNPLLLTMIANVHRYRGSLPGSRAELYSEMCQVMLWRRQEAKNLKLTLDVSGTSKERLLASVAFSMMHDRTTYLPRQKMLDAIARGLRRVSTSVSAENFLSDVVSNGLLIERDRDMYAYAHLTFQEYLAAKHIKEHDLGRVLTEAVTDTWWRETTLLYVAGSDADAIVRSCLEAGTASAVSLAFECTDIGAELAPDLRDRLNRILAETFSGEATKEQRDVAASVLAARQFRQFYSVAGGGLLCPRAVTHGLYWLFLQTHRVPDPEVPCSPAPFDTKPMTGIWSADAVAFVAWLNQTITRNGEALHRLPTYEELEDLANKPGPAAQLLASSVKSAWTKNGGDGSPRLWTRTEEWSPRHLTMADLLRHITRDVHRLAVLPRLQLLAGPPLSRVLEDRSPESLVKAVAIEEMFVHARSKLNDPEILGPARNRVAKLSHDLAEEQALALALDSLLRALDHTAMGHDLAQTLVRPATVANYARLAAALARASSLDRDLTIASGLSHDFGLSAVNDHARAIHRALIRATSRLATLNAKGMHVALQPSPVLYVLGIEQSPVIDISNSVQAVLSSLIGTTLGRAFMRVFEQDDSPELEQMNPEQRFASGLVALGTGGTDSIFVDLDTVSGQLHQTCASFDRAHDPHSAAMAARLFQFARPILGRERPAPATAAFMRLSALVLAADARRLAIPDVADRYLAIAGAATLLQTRASHPENLEAVVVARA